MTDGLLLGTDFSPLLPPPLPLVFPNSLSYAVSFKDSNIINSENMRTVKQNMFPVELSVLVNWSGLVFTLSQSSPKGFYDLLDTVFILSSLIFCQC